MASKRGLSQITFQFNKIIYGIVDFHKKEQLMFLLYILPYRFQRTWEGLTTISLIKVLLWREGVYKRGRKDILAFLIFSQFLILFSFFKGASVKLNKSLKKILVRSESKLLRICLLNIATKNMYHKRRFHSAWMFLENQSLIQFFLWGGRRGAAVD